VFGAGAAMVAVGLAWFAWIPPGASFAADLLPGLLLLGGGGGLLFLPLTTAATSPVPPEHTGSAAGLLSSSQHLGGAIGLAVLASAAAARTHALRGGGAAAALSGYRLAFWLSAALAMVAALLGALRLPAGGRLMPAKRAVAGADPVVAPDAPDAPSEHGDPTAPPAPAWGETDPR